MTIASASHRPASRAKGKRPSTAHLKDIPETKGLREQIRAEATLVARELDRCRPLSRERLKQLGEQLLNRMGLGEQYLGFAMVTVSNDFWRDQLMAVPFERRLLLLPHCLKHAEGCPADYDEFGLDCRRCGACSIADFKTTAEDLGYKVLVAEGTPIVLKIIVSGYIDAIVGVACLNVLEKALDKVLKVGVPSLAVPLLSSDCKNTSVDTDWVTEVIGLRQEAPQQRTRTYLHLLRAANDLFEPKTLERLAPRTRSAGRATGGEKSNGKPARTSSNGNGAAQRDPLTTTEQMAYDWLARGGKRFRPFITLASHDAVTGAKGSLAESAQQIELSDSVRRVALAIEIFHKASLIHDDIEDDDSHRYGRETLHRRHGVPVALNAGDYLIGLGYRVAGRDTDTLGTDCVADIVDRLADAHLRLSEGQGAELVWRDAERKTLTPVETLKIFALKTAPAFEAALYAGLRLAGPVDAYRELLTTFSRHLGIAFQILNDLKDWEEDAANKCVPGQDALSGRPTVLLALALEGASEDQRNELLRILHQPTGTDGHLERVRQIYESAGAFEKARRLVEKYRQRAEATADEAEPTELRELLYFLVDTVLEDPPEAEEAPTTLHQIATP